MPKILPPSQRQKALAQTQADLAMKSEAAFVRGSAHLEGAKEHGTQAAADLKSAASHALDALDNSGRALGHSAKGAAYAALGATVRLGEEIGDLAGAALQGMGRGFIAAGNWLRSFSGGPQIVVETVEGKNPRNSLSDRLFARSGAEFERSASHFSSAVSDIIQGGGDMKSASKQLLSSAEESLKAARHLGEAAAIKTAEGAVAAARATLDAVERGVDGAGALMQEAGQKMIAAGNAVNTARGTDTGVRPQ